MRTEMRVSRTRLSARVVIMALGAVLATTPELGAAADPSRPGLTPSLSLPDATGAAVSLESLKGRVVLVDIWASWCPPCKAAFPAYDALFTEYRDRGLEVLAINVDETRKAADAFLRGRTYAVRVLFDPTGSAPAGFKLKAMPTSYLVDRKGVTRFAHEGFNERVLAQYRREIEQLLEEMP